MVPDGRSGAAGNRFDRPVLEFLSRDEMQALLDAPDGDTWSGQRDTALFAVLYNTGAGVSEIIRLRVADVLLDRAHAVHLHGKGRKERVIAMWLGHEDTATTHQYIEADTTMKEAALKRLDAPSSQPVRFKAADRLLAFLETL